MTDPIARRATEKNVSIAERMALLHTLVLVVLRITGDQLEQFTSRLVVALSAQADDSADGELYRHAATHLGTHSTTFQRIFNDCLQQALMQAVQAAGEQGAVRLQSHAIDLSLLTFEAMQHKVLIDNLSQALDAAHAETLAVLSLRIAHCLQSDETGTAHNPFRSEVFFNGVSDAWQKFDMKSAALRPVLQQMQPDVFLQLGPVWHALNQELVARHVLPEAEQLYRHRKNRLAMPVAPALQHRLQRWLAPAGKLNVIDARGTQLLEEIFAQVLQEEVIPAEVRNLLARSQESLRKAALADNDFFFNAGHSARRLSETAIAAGLACAGPGDPLYHALEQAVQRMQQELVSFEDIARELEAAVAEDDRQFDIKLVESIAQAISQENMARAQRQAEDDVTARIETGEVTGFVETFLQTQWTHVLAFAYRMRDAKPEVLPKVQTAMDDLIWSLKPKTGAEERRELVGRLPALLSLLNAWLNVVKWEGEERQAFFTTLAERHAAAMRAADEPTPRHQLELRMDMVQKASEYQLGKRARKQQEEALAETMQQAGQLQPGDWFGFVRNNGSRINCKLTWVSPGRSRFIFIKRQAQLVFTLTDEAFAQALRASRINGIVVSKLIERALAAALEKLDTH